MGQCRVQEPSSLLLALERGLWERSCSRPQSLLPFQAHLVQHSLREFSLWPM